MTTVLVCADEPNPALGLALAGRTPVVVDELCARPDQVASMIPDDETSLVLAIHRDQANLGAIQTAVRKLGFDSLGVGIVDLSPMTTTEQVRLAAEGSIARVAAYPGSLPEQVKLLPAERNTRRAFLSIGAPIYVGAPMIDETICVAAAGCRSCVAACPEDALAWSGGAVNFDVNTCVACGICLTTCPVGAIHNPSADPMAVEAEIKAVVTRSSQQIGIRYRCRDSLVAGEDGWHLMDVPCTGMLTLGWLLAPLLLGASSVDAVSCTAGGCDLGNSGRLEATMEDFGRTLDKLSTHGHKPSDRRHGRSGTGWFAHDSTGRVLAEMTSTSSGFLIGFDSADVGLVLIDPSTCTACEMCAQVCPTNALTSNVDASGVHISFDPQICVACGQCLATCPEVGLDAIALTRGFDSEEWSRGRREVRHEPTPRCEICGEPVAPMAMLSRIKEMLGEDATPAMDLISRRCVNCRGR